MSAPVAEAKARGLILSSGLPPPRWNPRVHDQSGRLVAVPDAWFDEVALAWEIDSVEFHLSPADYARTLDRRSAMMAEGVIVMHTMPSKLVRRSDEVLDELRRTHHQATLRPRPPLVARRAGESGAVRRTPRRARWTSMRYGPVSSLGAG